MLHGCSGCGYFNKSQGNQCVFKDDAVNETAARMREADGIILASPTYFGGIAGTTKAFLDRVFFQAGPISGTRLRRRFLWSGGPEEWMFIGSCRIIWSSPRR